MIKGVKYISAAETSGYGLSAAGYIRALIDNGVPVSWHPLIQGPGGYRQTCSSEVIGAALATSRDVEPLLNALHAPVDYDTVVVHMAPEHWPGYIEPGKRMVGYTTWETDRLPAHWPRLLTGYDLILTPSTFSRELLAAHASCPVTVVPHLPRAHWPAADPAALAGFRRRFGIGEHEFMFYTVNTWFHRKALWLTVHAFLLAFGRQDGAVLLVKTTPYGEAEGYQGRSSRQLFDAIVASHLNRARVEYVSSELDDNDIARLHLAGDAYVSLSRGEGFGLGAFDAACAGTPVIATGWSGHLDFLPADSACLVDYRLCPVGAHLFHHPPQEQYWAHADLDHAIDWMRRLYHDPADAAARGRRLKEYAEPRFNAESITRRLLDALDG